MANKYRYTGGRHKSENGDVVYQGDVYEPTEADLRNKEDLWEPVTEGASVAGANIGIRALPMTDAAMELALEADLSEEDFEGIEPAGSSGDYLKSQVVALIEGE